MSHFSLSALLTLCTASAAPVTLQQPTASFSQAAFSPAELINNTFSGGDEGWAVGGTEGTTSIAVFETTADISFAGGSKFTLTLTHSSVAQLNLGHFRFLITTDDRSTFADGASTGGDVDANWIPLIPESATAISGATMTIDPSTGSVLVSGGNPAIETYTVVASTPVQAITGLRLEALPHPSLPLNGPGRHVSGNFILTELEVSVEQVSALQDDFNDNTKNLSIWGADVVDGSATLTETNQRLELTGTAGAFEEPFIVRPLAGSLSLMQDFFVQLDVTMPDVVTGPGFTAAGLGLIVVNPDDLNDNFEISLSDDGNEGISLVESLVTDDADLRDNFTPSPSNLVTVGISWNVGNQELTLVYDPDGPANGFAFQQIGTTFNPISGWGMSPTGSLLVGVLGFLENNVTLTSGSGVFADNFVSVAGAFQPTTINLLPTLQFDTVLGRTYLIDAADSPAGPYLQIGSLEGTGSPEAFVDARPLNTKQFYRVRQQLTIP